jgi:hypothetical protein
MNKLLRILLLAVYVPAFLVGAIARVRAFV